MPKNSSTAGGADNHLNNNIIIPSRLTPKQEMLQEVDAVIQELFAFVPDQYKKGKKQIQCFKSLELDLKALGIKLDEAALAKKYLLNEAERVDQFILFHPNLERSEKEEKDDAVMYVKVFTEKKHRKNKKDNTEHYFLKIPTKAFNDFTDNLHEQYAALAICFTYEALINLKNSRLFDDWPEKSELSYIAGYALNGKIRKFRHYMDAIGKDKLLHVVNSASKKLAIIQRKLITHLININLSGRMTAYIAGFPSQLNRRIYPESLKLDETSRAISSEANKVMDDYANRKENQVINFDAICQDKLAKWMPIRNEIAQKREEKEIQADAGNIYDVLFFRVDNAIAKLNSLHETPSRKNSFQGGNELRSPSTGSVLIEDEEYDVINADPYLSKTPVAAAVNSSITGSGQPDVDAPVSNLINPSTDRNASLQPVPLLHEESIVSVSGANNILSEADDDLGYAALDSKIGNNEQDDELSQLNQNAIEKMPSQDDSEQTSLSNLLRQDSDQSAEEMLEAMNLGFVIVDMQEELLSQDPTRDKTPELEESSDEQNQYRPPEVPTHYQFSYNEVEDEDSCSAPYTLLLNNEPEPESDQDQKNESKDISDDEQEDQEDQEPRQFDQDHKYDTPQGIKVIYSAASAASSEVIYARRSTLGEPPTAVARTLSYGHSQSDVEIDLFLSQSLEIKIDKSLQAKDHFGFPSPPPLPPELDEKENDALSAHYNLSQGLATSTFEEIIIELLSEDWKKLIVEKRLTQEKLDKFNNIVQKELFPLYSEYEHLVQDYLDNEKQPMTILAQLLMVALPNHYPVLKLLQSDLEILYINNVGGCIDLPPFFAFFRAAVEAKLDNIVVEEQYVRVIADFKPKLIAQINQQSQGKKQLSEEGLAKALQAAYQARVTPGIIQSFKTIKKDFVTLKQEAKVELDNISSDFVRSSAEILSMLIKHQEAKSAGSNRQFLQSIGPAVATFCNSASVPRTKYSFRYEACRVDFEDILAGLIAEKWEEVLRQDKQNKQAANKLLKLQQEIKELTCFTHELVECAEASGVMVDKASDVELIMGALPDHELSLRLVVERLKPLLKQNVVSADEREALRLLQAAAKMKLQDLSVDDEFKAAAQDYKNNLAQQIKDYPKDLQQYNKNKEELSSYKKHLLKKIESCLKAENILLPYQVWFQRLSVSDQSAVSAMPLAKQKVIYDNWKINEIKKMSANNVEYKELQKKFLIVDKMHQDLVDPLVSLPNRLANLQKALRRDISEVKDVKVTCKDFLAKHRSDPDAFAHKIPFFGRSTGSRFVDSVYRDDAASNTMSVKK